MALLSLILAVCFAVMFFMGLVRANTILIVGGAGGVIVSLLLTADWSGLWGP